MSLLRHTPTIEEIQALDPTVGKLPEWAARTIWGMNTVAPSFGATLPQLLATVFWMGVQAERLGWDTDLRGIGPEGS